MARAACPLDPPEPAVSPERPPGRGPPVSRALGFIRPRCSPAAPPPADIKKEFDKKYGPTWHCIVGRNFGSYVTHETKHFLYFYLGQVRRRVAAPPSRLEHPLFMFAPRFLASQQVAVLLFKSG